MNTQKELTTSSMEEVDSEGLLSLSSDLLLKIGEDFDTQSIMIFSSVNKQICDAYGMFRVDIIRVYMMSNAHVSRIAFVCKSHKCTHYLLPYLIRNSVFNDIKYGRAVDDFGGLVLCTEEESFEYFKYIISLICENPLIHYFWMGVIRNSISIICRRDRIKHLEHILGIFGNDIDIASNHSHLCEAISSVSIGCVRYLVKVLIPITTDLNVWKKTLNSNLLCVVCRRTILGPSDKKMITFNKDLAEVIKIMLDLGETRSMIDIHYLGELPFRCLSSNGHLEALKVLVAHAEAIGSPINIHNTGGNMCAFEEALVGGKIDVCKYLVQLGEGSYGRIDIHCKDDEYIEICLKRASSYSAYTDLCGFLIDLGEKGYGPYRKGYVERYRKIVKAAQKALLS